MPVSYPPSLNVSDSPSKAPDERFFSGGGGGGGPTPAPSCSVALSGAIGPAFGFSSADTSGQTFSVTSAGTGVYLASSPFSTSGDRRSMPASGKKVWFEVGSYSSSGSSGSAVFAGCLLFNGAGSAIGYATANSSPPISGTTTVMGLYTAAGSNIATVPLPQGAVSYLSIGVDDSGEIYFYRADTGAVVAASSIDGGAAGAFSGAASIILFGQCDLSSAFPASHSATFTIDQSSMSDISAFSGDEDWCGNTI